MTPEQWEQIQADVVSDYGATPQEMEDSNSPEIAYYAAALIARVKELEPLAAHWEHKYVRSRERCRNLEAQLAAEKSMHARALKELESKEQEAFGLVGELQALEKYKSDREAHDALGPCWCPHCGKAHGLNRKV